MTNLGDVGELLTNPNATTISSESEGMRASHMESN